MKNEIKQDLEQRITYLEMYNRMYFEENQNVHYWNKQYIGEFEKKLDNSITRMNRDVHEALQEMKVFRTELNQIKIKLASDIETLQQKLKRLKKKK